MGNAPRVNINTGLNSLTLLLVAGIAWFTVQEISENRHSREVVNDIRVNVATMQGDVNDFKRRLDEMALESQLREEISKRESQVDDLQKSIRSIERRMQSFPKP